MKCIVAEERIDYDGSQIGSLWAYTKFGVQDDSIVCFRGRCNIPISHMIDLEDRIHGERIESPDMIHFIVEHFDMPSLRLAYTRQRLLACIAGEALKDMGFIVSRSGDDLFFKGQKLSISIASTGAASSKIHFGINVECEDYMSLNKMGLKDPDGLMRQIGERYAAEVEDIEKDMRKSRPLEVFR
ncbi:DUF366 family protein [Methanocella conradii]|uniref:DUF366 family protein n=1 Tax=Methanocella conradii TaxID=1175444 RepID=UPI0024B377F7|nr:DUF366 family protein [Methanocella conradii]MDI6896178.1 DUF366 family protein [Methanocella conradii]